ncbi:MAG: hypothetical protein ACJ8F3_12970 [Xanthobacteraceae bacterium]
MRPYVLALGVFLSGCSASEIVQNWTAPEGNDLPQPDYRRVVADNIKAVFPDPAKMGAMDISGVRLVDHLKGQAWITCLRREAEGHPQHYAIFIQNDKIIDFRAAVVIDQCHKETYTPFDSTVTKKPGS